MLSLAERHEDRARRIAMNETERNGDPTGDFASVGLMFRNAMAARARLTKEEQAELDTSLENIETEFGGVRSLAEAPDGSGRTMAGIGVINTKVVPAGVHAAEAGNGGGSDFNSDAGWGETPPVTVKNLEPAEVPDGNISGQSLQDQGAGSDLSASAAGAEAGTVETATGSRRSRKAAEGGEA